MNSTLRLMKPEDIPHIILIFQIANPNESLERIQEYTTNVLTRFPHLCWICEESKTSRIIGGITASILKKGEKGYILDIAVDTEFQGLGLGKNLLEHIKRQFQKIDIQHISLGVHYLNAKVIPFYYQYGFRMHEVRKNEFGPNQDAIIMHYHEPTE